MIAESPLQGGRSLRRGKRRSLFVMWMIARCLLLRRAIPDRGVRGGLWGLGRRIWRAQTCRRRRRIGRRRDGLIGGWYG